MTAMRKLLPVNSRARPEGTEFCRATLSISPRSTWPHSRIQPPSRPVQQGEVFRSRDQQETFVTATSALLIQTWTDPTRTSPQFHRCHVTRRSNSDNVHLSLLPAGGEGGRKAG
ncbi:MAG: hypothetical protein DWI22_11790 [Planctomycetota bacterium]|nr:MAG: hypothetical protein DWI22_11790 [Planctomycetota bacterium]